MLKFGMMTATLLVTLTACGPTAGGGLDPDPDVDLSEWSAVVSVVDQDGEPLTPDEAFWYLPPEIDDTGTDVPLECLDEECTVFGVPLDVSGDFYVAANYERSIPDVLYCWYLGFDASPVNVTFPADMDQWSAVEITLQVETDSEACE